jgi:hypothetical protein
MYSKERYTRTCTRKYTHTHTHTHTHTRARTYTAGGAAAGVGGAMTVTVGEITMDTPYEKLPEEVTQRHTFTTF